MGIKAVVLMVLPILLLTTFLNSVVCADGERKVLSRGYVGLGVEVRAPFQCYPGENITVRVRIQALEEVRNVSVTLFLWGSRFEGENPWSTSFTVLDVTNFPNGTVGEEACNIAIPSDIDPGLTYGMLSLDWSIFQKAQWERQWDKASFRATYVRNRDCENLQGSYIQLENELHNTRITAYIFLAVMIALSISTIYLAKCARA